MAKAKMAKRRCRVRHAGDCSGFAQRDTARERMGEPKSSNDFKPAMRELVQRGLTFTLFCQSGRPETTNLAWPVPPSHLHVLACALARLIIGDFARPSFRVAVSPVARPATILSLLYFELLCHLSLRHFEVPYHARTPRSTQGVARPQTLPSSIRTARFTPGNNRHHTIKSPPSTFSTGNLRPTYTMTAPALRHSGSGNARSSELWRLVPGSKNCPSLFMQWRNRELRDMGSDLTSSSLAHDINADARRPVSLPSVLDALSRVSPVHAIGPPADARRAVADLKRSGADFIKLQSLSRAKWSSHRKEAKNKLPFEGTCRFRGRRDVRPEGKF